jgi:hypothetical protein
VEENVFSSHSDAVVSGCVLLCSYLKLEIKCTNDLSYSSWCTVSLLGVYYGNAYEPNVLYRHWMPGTLILCGTAVPVLTCM